MKSAKPDIRRLIELQQLLLRFHDIERRIRNPNNFDRHETDTEHTLALVMAAWLLAQYVPHVNTGRAIRLAFVHDLLEIHAGDTFAFDNQAVLDGKAAREAAAVQKLSQDWPDFPEVHDAIKEYEARATNEAKFVYALDKLMPIIMNYLNQGRTWRLEGITFEKLVAEKAPKIPVSPEVNEYYKDLLKMLEKHPDYFAPSSPKP